MPRSARLELPGLLQHVIGGEGSHTPTHSMTVDFAAMAHVDDGYQQSLVFYLLDDPIRPNTHSPRISAGQLLGAGWPRSRPQGEKCVGDSFTFRLGDFRLELFARTSR